VNCNLINIRIKQIWTTVLGVTSDTELPSHKG